MFKKFYCCYSYKICDIIYANDVLRINRFLVNISLKKCLQEKKNSIFFFNLFDYSSNVSFLSNEDVFICW